MEILNKNTLFFSLITTMFFSCNFNQNDKLLELTENWRKDTLGCMNLRNKQYSDNINKEINFKGKSEIYLIKYLGKSNKVKANSKYKYLVYYFDTRCENNIIVDSIDQCHLQYRIDLRTEKIVDYQNICQ